MVTGYVPYRIDPEKVTQFQHYAEMWRKIVPRLGGTHYGYFLPHESANDVALALASFPSLATYEEYPMRRAAGPECQAAYAEAAATKRIIRYDRAFLWPMLE